MSVEISRVYVILSSIFTVINENRLYIFYDVNQEGNQIL